MVHLDVVNKTSFKKYTKSLIDCALKDDKPKSLDEIYAIVGSFPFTARKLALYSAPTPEGPVGSVYDFIALNTFNYYVCSDTRFQPADPDIKVWVLHV